MTQILSDNEAKAILKRMAYQLYEINYEVKTLLLLGVDQKGYFIAGELAYQLKQISSMNIHCAPLDKQQGLSVAALEGLKPEVIVLVDDVLYTGKTLFLALTQAATLNPKRVQIAVLIDRGHRDWPLSPDVVGRAFATTLQDYITVNVDFETGQILAFMN